MERMRSHEVAPDKSAAAKKQWEDVQAQIARTYEIRDTFKNQDVPELEAYKSPDYEAKDTELRMRQDALQESVDQLLAAEDAGEDGLIRAMELRNDAYAIEVDRRLYMYAAEKFAGIDQARVFWRSGDETIEKLNKYIASHEG